MYELIFSMEQSKDKEIHVGSNEVPEIINDHALSDMVSDILSFIEIRNLLYFGCLCGLIYQNI